MCENVLFLRILNYFNIAMNLMRFVVPIILIIKLTLDIYKGIINPNDNSFKEKVSKRLVACVIIFLVPTIVNVFLGLIETVTGTTFDYSSCQANIKNIDYYVEKRELEEKLLYEQQSSENYKKYQAAIEDLTSKIKANSGTVSNASAVMAGQKYTNLTETEVKELCGVAKAEQGSIDGARAEASLMANLYELLDTSSKYYGKGLRNYVRNSGWFAHAASHMSQGVSSCPSDYIQAVRDVLVNGNRTLPLYVNEHDYHGDISKIVVNGQTLTGSSNIKNHSNYIKDSTVIYNKMGAVYTFYTFPSPTSDPFGYTAKAKSKVDAMNK